MTTRRTSTSTWARRAGIPRGWRSRRLVATPGPRGQRTDEDEPIPQYVALGAVPDPLLRSDRFPVMCLPKNDWDDFVLTVYFSTQPETDQRREFRELIRSWFIVGQYGGLGEPGLSSFQNVRFDDARESASVRADMIGSDPELALPVLIRALEGYDASTAPIEAVVFGHADDRE